MDEGWEGGDVRGTYQPILILLVLAVGVGGGGLLENKSNAVRDAVPSVERIQFLSSAVFANVSFESAEGHPRMKNSVDIVNTQNTYNLVHPDLLSLRKEVSGKAHR